MKILTFVILASGIFLTSNAFSQELFNFNGILWTDTREVISEKLKKSGDFEGLRGNSSDQSVKSIASSIPYYLIQNDMVLNKLNAQLNKCDMTPIVRVYADENMQRFFSEEKDQIITRNGKFYFSSYDNKLLFYTIEIEPKKSEIVLQSLQKKYGEGVTILNKTQRNSNKSDWIKWTKGDEMLFFSHQTQGREPLVYVNISNLQSIIPQCMEEQQMLLEKNKAKSNSSF